jgi:hypothetical protein
MNTVQRNFQLQTMVLCAICSCANKVVQGSGGGPNTAVDQASGAVNQDREAHALAAGFSLGLINIGRGQAAAGVATGSGGLVESLKRLVRGGAWSAFQLLACASHPLTTSLHLVTLRAI